MNADDFERKLQRQPLRKIPKHWRAEILQAAQETAPSVQRPQPRLSRAALTIWRELIQPCRYAWSGMAALWLVFWVVNSQSPPVPTPKRMAKSAPVGSGGIRLLVEQREVLAELTGPNSSSPVEPSRRTHPKPRSERKSGVGSC